MDSTLIALDLGLLTNLTLKCSATKIQVHNNYCCCNPVDLKKKLALSYLNYPDISVNKDYFAD